VKHFGVKMRQGLYWKRRSGTINLCPWCVLGVERDAASDLDCLMMVWLAPFTMMHTIPGRSIRHVRLLLGCPDCCGLSNHGRH
jgi:hypothetical protein